MNSKIKGSFNYHLMLIYLIIRFQVKYRDGILQDIDRPLNPRTRKFPIENGSIGASPKTFANSKGFQSQSPGGKGMGSDGDDDPEDSFVQQVKRNNTHSGISESLSKMKG